MRKVSECLGGASVSPTCPVTPSLPPDPRWQHPQSAAGGSLSTETAVSRLTGTSHQTLWVQPSPTSLLLGGPRIPESLLGNWWWGWHSPANAPKIKRSSLAQHGSCASHRQEDGVGPDFSCARKAGGWAEQPRGLGASQAWKDIGNQGGWVGGEGSRERISATSGCEFLEAAAPQPGLRTCRDVAT